MSIANLATVTRSAVPTVIWAPILVGSAAVLSIAAWTRFTEPAHAGTGARLGTILLVTGLAFAIEDSAANTTAASPVPLRTRCFTRAALPVSLCTAAWLTAVALAPLSAQDNQVLGAELLALCFIGAGTGFTALRLGLARPGLIVGPVLFGLVILSSRLGHYPILPSDLASLDDPRVIERAYTRLALIAAVAGVAIAAATRDPIRRRPAVGARNPVVPG